MSQSSIYGKQEDIAEIATFFNPIMVDNYAGFFNCTTVGRASDSIYDGPDLKLFILVGWGRSFLSVA